MLDVLIRGGWVADGTGNPTYPADVSIEGDRIVEVGRLDGAVARRVIEADGKIVCPGFVDVNGHSDWTLFANPTKESTVRQGVTTEVVGNCIGHNTLRLAAGVSGSNPSEHERNQMGDYVREAMDAGALGFTTGWSSSRGYSRPPKSWSSSQKL